MTNFIPIFPLQLVVYPGETLNLHIFEPRYKELISECLSEKKLFGVPSLISGRLQDYGTTVEIMSLEKTYDNGEMDIRTRGVQVFRVLEVIKSVPEKRYSGAIVHYPHNHDRGNPELMKGILQGIRKLHDLMEVTREFRKADNELVCYDIAHDTGLSLEQEYEMLCLLHERQRQEFLKLHLTKVLPVMAQIDRLKKRVRMNGHFQGLESEGFDF